MNTQLNQPLNRLQAIAASDNLVKKVVIGVILLAVVSFLINFIGYSTLVHADFGGNSNTVEAYSFDSTKSERSKLKKLFGLYVVPRSSQELLFTTSDSEAIVNLATNPLSIIFANLTVNIDSPIKAKLVAVGSQDCFMTTGGTAYGYRCNQPTSFTRLSSTNPEQRTSIGEFESRYLPSRYANGILMLNKIYDVTNDQNGLSFSYVEPGKLPVERLLPANFYDVDDYVLIYTDQTNQRNSGFVAYNNKTGVGYYYKSFSDTSAPKRFTRQTKVEFAGGELSACTLTGTTFSCYNGSPAEENHYESADGAEVSDAINNGTRGVTEQLVRDGVIEVTQLSGSTTTQIYAGPKDYGMMEIFTTANGTLYGKHELAVDKIELHDKTFSTKPIAGGANSVSASSSLYYIQNGKLYGYDDATGVSKLYYQQSGENLDKVVAYGDSLLLSALTLRDPLQLLHVYQLSNN